MADLSREFGTQNLAFVEALYAQWREDPSSVATEWQRYFDALSRTEDGPVQLGPRFGLRSIFNPPNGHATTTVASGELSSRASHLRALPALRELPQAELEEAAKVAVAQSLPDGALIQREGETGGDLYLLVQGKVQLRRSGRVVAELGPGGVIGELALLDQRPRSADAVAVGPVSLLRIPEREVLGLVERRPQFALAMVRLLAGRLRDSSNRQDRVDQLIRAYRVRGHLLAELDPLNMQPKPYIAELDPEYYGLGAGDLDLLYSSNTIPGAQAMSLREILAHLQNTYCRNIGVQFMHIDDPKVKLWLQDRMEATENTSELTRDQQLRILTKLTDAEIFEQFIHKKFIGAKRFSLEGAESMIPLLDMALEAAGQNGVKEVVIGMAHRGRLNVLANVMGKSPRQIFQEFDDSDPDKYLGRGDVKYHLGYSSDRVTASGHKVHLSLTFNPSHLEFVNPVVVGRVRAKQDRFGDTARTQGLGIVIHGDAAIAGQGVVQETFNMSELAGYGTGGTLHLVVNNQIGFTTNPSEGRSSHYATDVAKMLQIPIFHVNGEQPEAVAQVIRLAMEFRATFRKDVVIDMYCYRRYGHNEGDEPAFTQPVLYKKIRERKSVREGYLDNLYRLGQVTPEQADRIVIERRERLEQELSAARASKDREDHHLYGEGLWKTYRGGRDEATPDVSTAVPQDILAQLLEQASTMPPNFTPHPKIDKLYEQRRAMARGEQPLDWGAAETAAFASLAAQGARVRLSGQDAGRGTFSHRHAQLRDFETDKALIPLQAVAANGGSFHVFNSPLSEIGVMGFEYGYSLDTPDGLVIWEAQFGDFANVAQVIIDQFISSGEDKWGRLSGLTLLLPHGFEGQGPEHSSARLERFLVAAAEDNIQVCNLTTPAQIFHALRRQVVRPLRKPLVIMSPKSLLRHPKAVSNLQELSEGQFQHFIPDAEPRVVPGKVRKILLTSGKLYYELEKHREDKGAFDVAIVRIEQLYPLREAALQQLLSIYPAQATTVWVQEEPRNNGAWGFWRIRYGEVMFGRPLVGVTRRESASPATGSGNAHKLEQARLLDQAFQID